MNGKVLLRLHLKDATEREATATITANTGAPVFHHKAAAFKQGKLLLLIVNQEVNKPCIEALLTFEGFFIVNGLFNFNYFN